MFQFVSEDCDIRPFTTWVWPVHPYDPSGLNTYRKLISQSSLFELVAVPAFVEWRGVPNGTVGSIHSHLASLAAILVESVLPTHL